MNKKYDIAFAPLNERLLKLTITISNLLVKNGYKVCILKTSFHGEKLSAFKNKNLVSKISNITPIVKVPFTQFKSQVGFLKNIFRTIMTHHKLNSYWEPPYKILVTFMDDYGSNELLNIFSKNKDISTIMLQEGSEVRKKKYNFSFYDLCLYFRNLIFRKYFNYKPTGFNSDYVASWSKLNYKFFLDNGRSSKNTFIVGSPFRFKRFKKKNKVNRNILILHQILYDRYSSKKWNNELWMNLSLKLIKKNYNVFFKPHPRSKSLNELLLIKNIKKKALKIKKTINFLNKDIPSENLLKNIDIMITCISVGANQALANGIPVIFIDLPLNKNFSLNALKKNNDIILVKNWSDALSKIDLMYRNKNEMKKWQKKGYSSFIKLAGDPNLFNKSWLKLVDHVIKINN